MSKSRLDRNGHEVLDDTPMAIPAGFKRPETLAEQVQRLVRTTVSRQAEEAGFETFEESEDFDVDDGDATDRGTPYETYFDPVLGKELTPAEFMARENEYRLRYINEQSQEFKRIDAQAVKKRVYSPQEAPARGAGGGQPPASTPPVRPSQEDSKGT